MKRVLKSPSVCLQDRQLLADVLPVSTLPHHVLSTTASWILKITWSDDPSLVCAPSSSLSPRKLLDR